MRLLRCSLLVVMLGCATTQPEPQSKVYPGRCELIRLEQRDLPSDQPSDHVALVATYRFGEPSAARTRPVAFTFQVTRSRAEDLRNHLIANTDVLCRPDDGTRALALPPSETLGSVDPLPASANPWPIPRLSERTDRKVHMGYTFWDAVDARDALLEADLGRAQTFARALRDRDYGDTLPQDWKPFIGDMRKHADQLAMAPDLETAAAELAMISLSCGNCHWFADHGPKPLPDARIVEPRKAEELVEERMLRHVIGSEQMWEGLILPSDHAWRDGTTVFTRAPLAPPIEDGMAIDTEMQASIEELRTLARNARVARSHKERAVLYGQMLAGCASCHYSQRR
jgi:hypothetical protein